MSAEDLAAVALGGVAKIVNTEIPALKVVTNKLTNQIVTDVSEEVLTIIPSQWVLGGLNSSGAETVSTTSYRSDFISVSNVKLLKLENNTIMVRVNLYNASKQFIRQAAYSISSYQVDPDVSFIRAIVNGVTQTSYVAYSVERVKTGTTPINIANAAKYNFLPTNDAATNTVALQAAVDGGGTIRVDKPGIYDIENTIKIGDNTTIEFCAGAYIRRMKSAGYVFVNKGAFTRTYNKNITIKGMNLICNGFESNSGELITGLRGQLSFFYVKNLKIIDFECVDLASYSYCIHVCTYNNLYIDRIVVEGNKDAVHLGKGKTFCIRNGYFKTYDDPIALNAHDYDTGNPQLGWIENGIIENCYDLADTSTVGFFARILGGSWLNWTTGMVVQKSDTVVNGGRLYRVIANSDGVQYTSTTAPTHTTGTVVLDGISWAMIQDDDVVYNAGCRNIHFKNIYLQKARPVAFRLHFDKDNYSRSYYPASNAPLQEDITFENVYMQAVIPLFIGSVTPINSIKLINCSLGNTKIELANSNVGAGNTVFPKTNITMIGTTFKGVGSYELVKCNNSLTADLKILGSTKIDATHAATFSTGVTVVSTDI